MSDDSIMIGTKEILISKALKYYDDPAKCQSKLNLSEKEYKKLLSKLIKRVQGQQSTPSPVQVKVNQVKVNQVKAAPEPAKPFRFQPPIAQTTEMLPMPQPSYQAASVVNPVVNSEPIKAPMWFDMMAGSGLSVEHGKFNNEIIGQRQLQRPFHAQQQNTGQFLHPQSQYPQYQTQQSQSQLQSQLQPQFQSQFQPQSQSQLPPTQPQFLPPQYQPQQTTAARLSNNMSSSRVFEVGRTDFPEIISRVPHSSRLEPKNMFSISEQERGR